jgi:hypothetical protein
MITFEGFCQFFGKTKQDAESLGSEVARLSRGIGLLHNEEKCAMAIKVYGRLMPHPIQRNETDHISEKPF